VNLGFKKARLKPCFLNPNSGVCFKGKKNIMTKTKNLFTKYFPVPKFLEMDSVGIDISDDYIRVIKLKNLKDEILLNKFAQKELAEGIVVNGKVKDAKRLIQIMSNLKKELKLNFVKVSLSDKHTYLFKIKIPKVENMTDKDIYGSLEFKLEENVPIKLENAIFNYDVIDEDKQSIELIVSVFPKQIMDRFTFVLNKSGLTPLAFEFEAQATALSVIRQGTKGIFMIIDFKSNSTNISIVNDQKVHFTSTIDIGGNDLSNAIEKELKISPEEAKKIKTEEGLMGNKKKESFKIMLKIISSLKDEINRYYIYWHTYQHKHIDEAQNEVDKIILCGEESKIKGLAEYLETNLNIKTELANVWVNTSVIKGRVPKISRSESLGYATAIGLSLEE
jgi:type IV pilus assembly protein PilM